MCPEYNSTGVKRSVSGNTCAIWLYLVLSFPFHIHCLKIPLCYWVLRHTHIIIYWHGVLRFSHFIVIFLSDSSQYIYNIALLFSDLKQVTTPMSLYYCIYLIYFTEQVCLSHTAIHAKWHIDLTYCIHEPKHSKLQYLLHLLLPCMCQQQICLSNVTYISQIQTNLCAYIRQLCQYECLIWTHCNQQCDQEHLYTYISYYWHMALNKYACHTAYVCSTALQL